jgi:hypothetical protein
MFLPWSLERSASWLLCPDGRPLRLTAAAVRAGRRPPPEAARSGLDGGEDGARLFDRDWSVRALSNMT